MRKLELKHWAAYLPYKVQIVQPGAEGAAIFILDVEGLRIMEVQGFDCFKLVLQPLQDIITEDLFVDMMFDIGGKMSDAMHDWMEYADSDPANIDNAILTAPYPVIEWALQNHIDIFSLIPAGLAIPK